MRAVHPPLGVVVGRDDLVASLVDALHPARPVTLTGPAGVGKTTAARAVAARSGRPVVWVDLAAGDGDDVPSRLGRAAGLTATSLDAVLDDLGSQSALVVLDDAERQVDEVAVVVDALSAREGTAVALVTSRTPLGLPSEQARPLSPLAVPATDDAEQVLASPAVQLFLQRFEARRGPEATALLALPVVAALCRRLDGLPLAVELAAAQSAVLSPGDVLSALSASQRALVARGRGGSERHASLSSALAVSWELLDPATAQALRALSVFRGSFDLEAANEVVRLSDTPHRLADLVEASLVQTGLDGRYALLQTTRADARERAQAAGESADIAQRHATWLRAALRLPPAEPPWGAVTTHDRRLFDELPTAVAWALDGGDRVLVAEALADCARQLVLHQRCADLDAWLSALLDPPTREALPAPTTAWLLLAQATARHVLGDAVGERALLAEGAALARTAGEPALRGLAELVRCNAAMAARDARDVLAIGEALDATGYDNPLVPHNLALAHLALGDPARASTRAEQSLSRARVLGSPGLLLKALVVRTLTCAAQDDVEGFAAAAVEALELALGEGVRSGLDQVLASAALAVPADAADLALDAAWYAGQHEQQGSLGWPVALDAALVSAGLRDRRLPGAPLAEVLRELARTLRAGDGRLPRPVPAELHGAAAAPRAPGHPLTARQLEVLRVLADGRTSAAAARALGMSARTLSKHLENAYAALGVSSRIEALERLRAAGAL